jgi:hypothetical protein
MAACRSSLENTRKMNLQPILNKNLPWVHRELELDVLGVAGKLVNYVVHLSKRKNLKRTYFASHKVPKQHPTSFWSQGILGNNRRPSLTYVHYFFPLVWICK